VPQPLSLSRDSFPHSNVDRSAGSAHLVRRHVQRLQLVPRKMAPQTAGGSLRSAVGEHGLCLAAQPCQNPNRCRRVVCSAYLGAATARVGGHYQARGAGGNAGAEERIGCMGREVRQSGLGHVAGGARVQCVSWRGERRLHELLAPQACRPRRLPGLRKPRLSLTNKMGLTRFHTNGTLPL
jgi:hypothetical protein